LAKRGRKPAITSDVETQDFAKQRRESAAGGADDQTDRSAGGSPLGDFAEELGTFLGNTERKAAEWLSQRKRVTEQLTAIRDKASSLLQQMGSMVPELPAMTVMRRRGRRRRVRKTEGSAVSSAVKRGPGRPPGSKRKRKPMSEEARARIAEAQRRRWATVKRAKV
jgi:hypothetical protein